MKIDYLQINSKFKNLDQVRIDFDETELMTVVVGWNGAGKSNVIEALVSIFRNLDLGESPLFAYEIQYKLGENESERWILVKANPTYGKSPSKQYDISVHYVGDNNLLGENWKTLTINQVKRDKNGFSDFLPRYLFSYYSGQSDRLEEYFKKHRTDFYRRLLKNELSLEGEIRPLFYAKPIHSQYVLLAFFIDDLDSDELIFLKNQIGIEELDSVHIVLRRPDWTKSSQKDELFWGADGVVREFLEKVYPYTLGPIKITRVEDLSLTGKNVKNEFFHLFIPNRTALQAIAKDLKPDEFFKMLESTLLSEIISEVRVRVKIKNLELPLSFRELSEGEQQLLTVLGLLKFTSGEDSLFLLDEPDTHLNPSWNVKYLNFLSQFVSNKTTSHIILATHSPLAIAELTRKQVQIMWKDMESKIHADIPDEDPRGMGYSGILTSDMFGLGSTLDEHTTNILRQRSKLLEKEKLNKEEINQLSELNNLIESLGFSSVHWDDDYSEYLRMRKKFYPRVFTSNVVRNPDVDKLRKQKVEEIIQKMIEKESEG